MEDSEGPTTFTVKRCSICKHHDSSMIGSGREPIYDHFCSHPNFENGKFIGTDDHTPVWCPFLINTNE